MKLSEYLVGLPRGAAAALAGNIGVSPVMVSQWVHGTKPVPVKRCVPIERATNGKVTRRDLRPADWDQFWPELVRKRQPATQEG